MVLDMFCHWNYVLENLFGRVEAVTAKAVTHIPERWDEQGERYDATADDAAYAHLRARRRHHRPDQLLVGGARSTATSSSSSRSTAPTAPRSPASSAAASSPASARRSRCGTPTCRPPRTSAASGARCPTTRRSATASARSGSSSSLDVHAGRQHPYDFAAGRARAAARRRRARSPRPRAAGSSAAVSARSTQHRATDDVGSRLPTAAGATVELREPRGVAGPPAAARRSRVAFAAAHVVADPLGENVPGAPAVVDWDATLAFRRHLFRYGLGVAEAMDTAQRNMGLDWPAVQELVRRSADQAREHGARIASGAGTDHRHRARLAGRRARRLRRAGRVRRGAPARR